MKFELKFTAIVILLLGVFIFNGCNDGVSDSIIAGKLIITGVTVPVLGETPVTAIPETEQFTGTVTWDGNWTGPQTFAGSKAYTATITVTAKNGYTLTGVAEDFFLVPGATIVTNPADSGVITAIFPETATVSIGDTALGGRVAYILQHLDPGYVEGEQRGLIAATVNQSSTIWAVAAYDTVAVPGGTGTELGTGSANTDNIIAQNGSAPSVLILYAAGLARAHNGGGYTDWYLPSQDELNQLYINKSHLEAFIDVYWSSSEGNASSAWKQDFVDGGIQGNSGKGFAYYVRAVRTF